MNIDLNREVIRFAGETHMEFLKLQNENARLKIEIKLLNERLKAEEDKNFSRKPKKEFNAETLHNLVDKCKNYDRRPEIDEMSKIGQEIDSGTFTYDKLR